MVHAEPTLQDASLSGLIKDFSACMMAYMILDNPDTSKKLTQGLTYPNSTGLGRTLSVPTGSVHGQSRRIVTGMQCARCKWSYA